MDLKQLVILALQASVLATVFGFGLNTKPADLQYLFRHPGLLVRSLVSVFVVMPVVAVLLVRLFNFQQTIAIALVALAISPVPPLLPQREMKAGADRAYGLGLMALLSLVAIVAAPLALKILELITEQPLAMAPASIARIVLVMTVVPLGAGMAVRAMRPALAHWMERPVAMVAKVLLPPALLALLMLTASAIWALVLGGGLIAMVVFLIVGLAVGHVMGGPDPHQSIVLALSTATRHPAIALSIATANFPEQRFGAAIVLFTILALLVAIPYLAWQRRHITTDDLRFMRGRKIPTR
jgi:BASS family bile acid:Na+ symporter